jgi:peptidoglycan LD-endopeptidase LytH
MAKSHTPSQSLIHVLQQHSDLFLSVLPYDLTTESITVFDLTRQNDDLNSADLSDTSNFTNILFEYMRQEGTRVAIGKYNENRIIYERSGLFGDEEDARSIHLGVDIWAQDGVAVHCPYEGSIHSFQDNAHFGDYGPTIILEHELDGINFYTLYGHLSRESLVGKEIGQHISSGEVFAVIGDQEINGNWPPHIHFQIMTNIGEYFGDFPGVARPSQRDEMLGVCVDPNLILRISSLE